MKSFHFTKRATEALPPHDIYSLSRETEYTDMECIGLHRPNCDSGNTYVICCFWGMNP